MNEIRIDLRGNPRLREYFSKKQDGASCRTEIVFDKKTITADGVLLGVMTSISPEGYEPPLTSDGGPPESKAISPDASEPVMVMIAGTAEKEKKPAEEPAYA